MALNFRYIIRFALAFIARFRLLLVLSVILGILVFFSLKFIGPFFFGHKVERIGITGRFRTDTLPPSILELAGDGLTKINSSGTLEPGLASSWETLDKGKAWIFHLKDGLVWQDGKKLTSYDINYEFSDLKIEKPDPKTIKFILQNPFSPFPSVVARPVFRKGFLGTGQWKVTKVSIAGNFVQEFSLENKKKDRKTFKFYPTEERTKLAYKLGEVDILPNIFNPAPFDSWKVASVDAKPDKSEFVAVFFNTQNKLLSEKGFRQALAYAIKKENFDGPRAISPISPSSWAFNPQVKTYNYDPQRARQLLDELPKDLKESLNIKLLTSPILLNTAEAIIKDWEAVGVTANVQVYSGISGDYQALLAIFDIPDDPDQYSVWHSTQTATNISHYQNPRIDKLLEDGRAELDSEQRRKIYLDFQRFLVEDSPAIFLYHPISYTIERK